MQKRYILWWMLLFATALAMCVTLTINMAIVSMVNFNKNEQSNESNNAICPNTTFFMSSFLRGKDAAKSSTLLIKAARYNWSIKEQNIVLSGFHWFSYLAILPASILTQKYGSKKVVGFAQGIGSVMCSLIPIFAGSGYLVVACIRAVQGILMAMSAPSGLYTILGNWSPAQERSTFGSAVTVGAGVGFAVGNFLYGYIAEHIHWHYIFHLTSICGIVWTVLWYLLIYDDPEKHPTITPEEKDYVLSGLSKTKLPIKNSIPWRKIITSVPFIVCIFGMNSSLWYFHMFMMYLPIYLKTTYGLNAQEIGTITSWLPLFCCVIILTSGHYSDRFIKSGKATVNFTRKTWAIVGGVIACIPLIMMALVKCDINAIILCITIGFLLRGVSAFGPALTIVDMSPKFCGILNGIAGTFVRVESFLFAVMISHLSGILDTRSLWAFVFIFTACFSITTNLLFVIFGSAEAQPWNYESSSDEKK